MEPKDFLTNEKLLKRFRSQFELVNHAIKLGQNMIHVGRDGRIKTEIQNKSYQVLTEIVNNVDKFEEVKILKDIQAAPVSNEESPREQPEKRKRVRSL